MCYVIRPKNILPPFTNYCLPISLLAASGIGALSHGSILTQLGDVGGGGGSGYGRWLLDR